MTYHRTRNGFVLTLWRWRVHLTFRRINRLLEGLNKPAPQPQPPPPDRRTP